MNKTPVILRSIFAFLFLIAGLYLILIEKNLAGIGLITIAVLSFIFDIIRIISLNRGKKN